MVSAPVAPILTQPPMFMSTLAVMIASRSAQPVPPAPPFSSAVVVTTIVAAQAAPGASSGAASPKSSDSSVDLDHARIGALPAPVHRPPKAGRTIVGAAGDRNGYRKGSTA